MDGNTGQGVGTECNLFLQSVRATPLSLDCLNIISQFVGFWDTELGAYQPNQIIYI